MLCAWWSDFLPVSQLPHAEQRGPEHLCPCAGLDYPIGMATMVADCPRCGAKAMTFDILSDVHVHTAYDWQHFHEVTSLCRRCDRPSLMLVKLHDINVKKSHGSNGSVTRISTDIGRAFKFDRIISKADFAAKDAPEFLPENIDRAFKEGTRCLAIGCHNAAAAMFRLCLDLATKSMLPEAGSEGGPNSHQRKNLAPRLEWLFEQKRLPSDLQELSAAVKDYGNDGAHDGDLDENEADDLYDFAFALLERLYTQPARLAEMRARRDGRKKPAQAAE